MGKGPTTTSYLQAAAQPKTYISTVPLQSYQQAGDFLSRIKEDTNTAQEELDKQSGTPGQIGARNAAQRVSEAGSYLASLPKGDRFTQANTGQSDPYGAARDAAQTKLSDAQQAYGQALQNINDPRKKLDSSTPPSWATSTIAEAMPGYTPPSS